MSAYEGQFENGTITVNVTQGTSPYTYTAYETNGSGVSTGVIAQDANGDSAQSIQNTQTYVFDNMPPGEYYVTAVDSQDCEVFGTTVIDSWPCTGFELSASISKHESAFQAEDGEISYTVTAGENWDGTTTTSEYTVSLILGGSTLETATTLTGSFTDLAPGAYTISVTETGSGSNCSDSVQLTINAFEEVLNRGIYWFHGGGANYATNFIGAGGGNWTDVGTQFAIEGDTQNTTQDLSVAMQYVIDNKDSEFAFPIGYAVLPEGQTIDGNGGQFEFTWGATETNQLYYIAIPDNADFTEDLTAGYYVFSENANSAGIALGVRSFEYDTGTETQQYKLYRIFNSSQAALPASFV